MNEGGAVTYVVKNRHQRHPELFDTQKLHDSLIAALLSAGVPSGHARQLTRRVTEDVLTWLEDRPEVTTNDIRRVAAGSLKTYHPDASYLYEHHRATL